MKNITVTANKKGKNVESHTCTFDETFSHHDHIHSTPFIDSIPCGYNSTKLKFTRFVKDNQSNLQADIFIKYFQS